MIDLRQINLADPDDQDTECYFGAKLLQGMGDYGQVIAIGFSSESEDGSLFRTSFMVTNEAAAKFGERLIRIAAKGSTINDEYIDAMCVRLKHAWSERVCPT